MSVLYNFGLSTLLGPFVCLVLALACGTTSAQINGPGSFEPGNKFSDAQWKLYERQLNALLKTRRDEEKEYVNEVVENVKSGLIPYKLVATSYGWVRNKRPDTKYPFVFFEQVLRIQGKKAKLPKGAVPKFDYRVYRKLIVPKG